MLIFHYHPDSCVFLGCSAADESPLEPGVFLVPAHATVIPPPKATEDEQAVFDGDQWTIAPIPQPDEPAPPTEEQLVTAATAKRDQLLAEATLAMAPLQDAVDLDDATPAEIALLKKWKRYRVALNRVPDQMGFPHSILWPVAPDAIAT